LDKPFGGPLVLEADGGRSALFEGEGGVGNLALLYLGGGTTTFTGLDNCSGPQVDEVETQTVSFSFQRTAEGFYDFTRSNVRLRRDLGGHRSAPVRRVA